MVNLQKATFAGGCFWCLDAVYRRVKGVKDVVSGYAGGKAGDASYEQVSSGNTGHAEAVQITFDPKVVSYGQLLHIFWAIHDPTSLNKQGADTGTQYRSAIFYHNEQQKGAIEKSIQSLEKEKIFDKKIVTEVVPLEQFYPAEDYHQDYYNKNPNAGYCNVVINPKLTKFKKEFASLLNE